MSSRCSVCTIALSATRLEQAETKRRSPGWLSSNDCERPGNSRSYIWRRRPPEVVGEGRSRFGSDRMEEIVWIVIRKKPCRSMTTQPFLRGLIRVPSSSPAVLACWMELTSCDRSRPGRFGFTWAIRRASRRTTISPLTSPRSWSRRPPALSSARNGKIPTTNRSPSLGRSAGRGWYTLSWGQRVWRCWPCWACWRGRPSYDTIEHCRRRVSDSTRGPRRLGGKLATRPKRPQPTSPCATACSCKQCFLRGPKRHCFCRSSGTRGRSHPAPNGPG